MWVYVGERPRMWSTQTLKEEYENGRFSKSWKVDIDKQHIIKDGIYFAVEAFAFPPHNKRKHQIIKRDRLKDILENCQQALYFRDLLYRGTIPCSRLNLEHAVERLPALLDLPNQRFKVTI